MPGPRERVRLAVVTNDIYTTEDADFLRRAGVLDPARIQAVQTGCCPHTAIRDDIAANLDAVEDLEAEFGPLDLILVESGGDNLTATFSRGLVDRQIFVLDVSGGDKVPRKGGPGVTTSDLLVINKTDLAPLVGASLEVMDRDAAAVRQGRPVIFSSLREDPRAAAVSAWVLDGLAGRAARRWRRSPARESLGHLVAEPGAGRRDPAARAAFPGSAHPAPDAGSGVPGRRGGRAAGRGRPGAADRRAGGGGLRLRTVAAAVALPGRDGRESVLSVTLTVGGERPA